jgi:hypothetical protein
MMNPKDYTVRCDKCQFKEYKYCEICFIRTSVKNAIEVNRKETERACASMQLCVNMIHDRLDELEKQIEYLKGFLNI